MRFGTEVSVKYMQMERKGIMRKMKRFLCAVMAAMMIAGSVQMPGVAVADEVAAVQQPENPVYDSETDSTEWDFVYFGTYPQEEVTGEALTDAITGAKYDKDGLAVVDGVTYKKLYKSNVVFKMDGVDIDSHYKNYVKETNNEAFYDWVDKEVAYFKCQPIRWRVLENDGSSLFLMADAAIDCHSYHTSKDAITWAESGVRSWLNKEFKDSAFTEEEQAAILTSQVVNKDNSFHGTDGGVDTQDQVFLMSVEEMTSEKYGFPADYKTYSKTRRMTSTDYARAMGAWLGTYNDQYYGNAWYLLRTPGAYPQASSLVYPFGHVYMDGYYVKDNYYAICPALRVDIDSTQWTMVSEEDTTARNAWLKEYPAEEKPERKALVYGDVNGDGEVTLSDARKALRISLRIESYETQMQKWAADVDADEMITTDDAALILQRALKLISHFSDVETNPEPLVQTKQEVDGKINFWIAADSISAVHAKGDYIQPLYGWGELIGDYFTSDVKIQKTGVSSMSTRSYTTETNYARITENMKPGDYLFISFGHNDERCGRDLYSDPFGSTSDVGSYKWALKNYYIDPAIRAGAQPVLVTPVARRYFYQGKLVNPQLHKAYADAMVELVEEYKEQGITVYLIDLHTQFINLYEELGEEGTSPLHGLISEGNPDNTHFSKAGATQACEWLVEGIKSQNMSLAQYLK